MYMVTTSAELTDPSSIGRVGLLAMAVASGIAVANIYYSQPMLGLIEAEFGGTPIVGFVPTATQLGYAIGLFLLLPLGDLLNRRRLIIGQFVVLALASVLAAVSPSAWLLVLASLALGASATVAQQIVPFAASLFPAQRRGATIGTVMAGVLSGILFSRTLSGYIGEHQGWREMFWLGVPLAVVGSVLMIAVLPEVKPVSSMPYGRALKSLVMYWKTHRVLRVATVMQALLFASFSTFWTILALYLNGPLFHLGADAAGLFGIVGAVGIFAAPFAGRIADAKGPRIVLTVGSTCVLLSWIAFGIFPSLTALVIGVVILDFGMQSALISNQQTVFGLDPEARSRLNTIFMTGMFLGGALGSAVATFAWLHGGWLAVSILGALFAAFAMVVNMFGQPNR